MDNFSQSAILFLEIAAALMMGLDYFFGRSVLAKINQTSRTYVRGVQAQVDIDISDSARRVMGFWPQLLVGVVMSLAFVSLFYASTLLFKNDHAWLGLGASLLSLFAFSSAAFAFLSYFFPPVLNILIALPFRIGTTLLLASPKGPIAAAGFGALLISLWLKYRAL